MSMAHSQRVGTVDVGATEAELATPVTWWVPLVLGITITIFGVMFLTNPGKSSIAFALVLGMYWFARGIVDVVLIFADRTLWGLKLLVGVVGIAAGWIVMQYVTDAPILGTLGLGTSFVWVLGFMGVVIGFADIAQAIQGAGWGRGLLGVLLILFGVWMMAEPLQSALSLPWAFGFLMILSGGALMVSAFQLKRA